MFQLYSKTSPFQNSGRSAGGGVPKTSVAKDKITAVNNYARYVFIIIIIIIIINIINNIIITIIVEICRYRPQPYL